MACRREEAEAGPGDVVTAAPGHDAWITATTRVIIDWQGMADLRQELTMGD